MNPLKKRLERDYVGAPAGLPGHPPRRVRAALCILAGAFAVFSPIANGFSAAMVSNTNEDTSLQISMAQGITIATRFTTDSSESAFRLDSVTILMGFGSTTGGFRLSIYDDGAGIPGSLVGTLSGEDAPMSPGPHVYTSSSIQLAANSSYWVVADVTFPSSTFYWWATTSTAYEGPWSLSPGYKMEHYGWAEIDSSTPMLSIQASAVPEPATITMLALAAAAVFARRFARRPARV